MTSDATPIAILLLGYAAGAGLRAPVDRRARGRAPLLGQLGLLGSGLGLTLALPLVGPLVLLAMIAVFGACLALAVSPRDVPSALAGGALGVAIPPMFVALGIGASEVRWLGLAALAASSLLAPRAVDLETERPVSRPRAAQGAAAGLCAGVAIGLYAAFAYRALAPYTGASTVAHAIFGTAILSSVALGRAFRVGRGAVSVGLGLLAALATVGLATAYPDLEWIVPGAVRRLGGLSTAARAFALVAAETAVFVGPVVGLLAAAGGGPPRYEERFAAVGVSLALLLGAPVVSTLSEIALGHEPFEQRYGPLLFLSENGTRATLVTDDPEQGRILRTSDGWLLGGAGEERNDRIVAQFPMLLHPAPQRVLQLGFGVGNGASSILSHPVERLDVVESVGLPKETASFFDWSNLDALSDDRLVLHDEDPWIFLRTSRTRWDVIRIFAAHLESADGRDVPTLKRLEVARAHLAPGGILSLELNIGRMNEEEVRAVLASMIDLFPSVSIFDGPLGFTWSINGSERPLVLLSRRVEQLLADPDVDAELRSLELDQVDKIGSHLVLEGADVVTRVGSAPPIRVGTTDLPVRLAYSPITFFGLGAAAADTALGDLTEDGSQENVGLARLFRRIQESKSWKNKP